MSMAATIPIIILVQILSTLENTITINYSQVQLSDIWSWPICRYLQPAKLDVLIITFLGLTCLQCSSSYKGTRQMASKAIQSDSCYEARENHHVTCDPRKTIPGTAQVVPRHTKIQFLSLTHVKGLVDFSRTVNSFYDGVRKS